MTFFTLVPDEELDIDSLEGYANGCVGMHPKPDGPYSTCFCGDTCKMNVSGDYKTLWQRYWMCDNLAYDPDPTEIGVFCKHLFCPFVSSICFVH